MKVNKYQPGHLCPRVVVAGLRGGSGKTVITLSIIKALKDRDIKIVPFKKGPDYIDAGWLAYAAGQPCYNLDPFLTGKKKVLPSFLEHTAEAHGAVIEGNRGIYDGLDIDGTYSTAELSKTLNSPVILIVDCTKTTRTTAAMVLGCQRFDPEVSLRGVILNRIANSRHESVVRKSIEHYTTLPVLGAVPKINEGLFFERHMGLVPYQEYLEAKDAIDTLKGLAEKYLDIDGIWKIAKEAESITVKNFENLPSPPLTKGGERGLKPSLRIGIIKDSAFQFYYPENFSELIRRGASLVEIDALKDKELPEIDAVYIGGGFPETHALPLAENISFRNSLSKTIEKGIPVYAECGGLMYLGEAIRLEGKTFPMAGIFPIVFGLEKTPQAHGYTIVEVERSNPFFPAGYTFNGHEFHYSKALNYDILTDMFNSNDIFLAFMMRRGQGLINKMDGLCYKNVLATYTHIHALGTGEWADGMIRQALIYREKRASEYDRSGKIALKG